MRTSIFGVLVAVLASALVGLGGCDKGSSSESRVKSRDALVFAVTLGGAPYSYADPTTSEPIGIDVELAKATAARLHKSLEIRVMDFPELLPAVKSGAADFAGAAITITPNRARDVDFTVPYAYDGSAFLSRADEPPVSMPRALALRVGTQTASISLYHLCRHGVDPVGYPTFEDALADFEKGKLDAVFYDAEPIRHVVAEANGRYLISPLETREYYGLAVSKKRPEITAAANLVITERGGAK